MGMRPVPDQGVSPWYPWVFGQRVMFKHQFGQPFIQNMGVDFGRRDICVPQQSLDRAQIGTIGQQMRRKGMAQRMRRDFSGETPP